MSARINPYAAAPEIISAVVAFETAVVNSGLQHSLIELVKTRASQIKGCAERDRCSPSGELSAAWPTEGVC